MIFLYILLGACALFAGDAVNNAWQDVRQAKRNRREMDGQNEHLRKMLGERDAKLVAVWNEMNEKRNRQLDESFEAFDKRQLLALNDLNQRLVFLEKTSLRVVSDDELAAEQAGKEKN